MSVSLPCLRRPRHKLADPPPDREEYPQYMTVERDGVNYDIPYKNDFT